MDPREPPRRQGAFCGLALTLCRARDQGGAALRGHSSFCKEPNPCPSTEEEVASVQGTASSTDPQTLHARGWAGLHVALWGQSQAWGTGTWGRGNRLLRKGYQGSHSTGPSISCAKPTQGSGSSFLPAFQLWDEMLQPLSLSFTSGQNTPVTCIVVQIGCQLCADRGPGPEWGCLKGVETWPACNCLSINTMPIHSARLGAHTDEVGFSQGLSCWKGEDLGSVLVVVN